MNAINYVFILVCLVATGSSNSVEAQALQSASVSASTTGTKRDQAIKNAQKVRR